MQRDPAVGPVTGGQLQCHAQLFTQGHTDPRDFAEQLATLTAASSSEGFLDRLFGTDCHARAVSALHQECRALSQESKAWLALRLVECQALTHGEVLASCPSTSPLKACLDSLTDRQWQLYVEFLAHTERYWDCSNHEKDWGLAKVLVKIYLWQ